MLLTLTDNISLSPMFIDLTKRSCCEVQSHCLVSLYDTLMMGNTTPLFMTQRRFILPPSIYKSHLIQISNFFSSTIRSQYKTSKVILPTNFFSKIFALTKSHQQQRKPPQKVSSTRKMGNPNQRSNIATRPQVARKAKQPAPLPKPQPTQCTSGACPIINYHVEKTYTAKDRDLPEIVKIKHAALSETLATGRFAEARAARGFLEHFYCIHGPADGSAVDALPQVPEKPKKCKDANCPVDRYHHEKTFEANSEDLPLIVKNKQKHLDDALKTGEYGHAVASRGFLERFFAVHGPSVLGTLPELPSPPGQCQNKLCPVTTWHADKAYGQHARDLPRLVKGWMARTWVIDSEMGDWAGSREQKLLNEFWSVHGGSAKGI